MYTTVKCSAVVHPNYRQCIKTLFDSHSWKEVEKQYPGVISTKSLVGRASTIPFCTSAYIPESWNNGEQCHYYNETNGNWLFICSLKNYENDIEVFIENVMTKVCSRVYRFTSLYEESWSPYNHDITVIKDFDLADEAIEFEMNEFELIVNLSDDEYHYYSDNSDVD